MRNIPAEIKEHQAKIRQLQKARKEAQNRLEKQKRARVEARVPEMRELVAFARQQGHKWPGHFLTGNLTDEEIVRFLAGILEAVLQEKDRRIEAEIKELTNELREARGHLRTLKMLADPPWNRGA